jgi:hypothetical protein
MELQGILRIQRNLDMGSCLQEAADDDVRIFTNQSVANLVGRKYNWDSGV